jgi:hypothetical protein
VEFLTLPAYGAIDSGGQGSVDGAAASHERAPDHVVRSRLGALPLHLRLQGELSGDAVVTRDALGGVDLGALQDPGVEGGVALHQAVAFQLVHRREVGADRMVEAPASAGHGNSW